MSFKVTVTSNINIQKHMQKIQDDAFWTFAANAWWTLYSPFVPMQTGALMESVHVRPKEIEHWQPYANRVYHGDGMNFRTDPDKHPLASARWDEAAKPTQEANLIKAMQDYIDSGRLNLNG